MVFLNWEIQKNGISQVQSAFSFLQFIDVVCETFSKFYYPKKCQTKKRAYYCKIRYFTHSTQNQNINMLPRTYIKK